MNKQTKEKILLYLSDKMKETEKRNFEEELQNSPALENELAQLNAKIEEFKTLYITAEDTNYFNNILPRVKEKLQQQTDKKLFTWRRAFALGFVSIVLIVLMFRTEPGDKQFLSINGETEQTFSDEEIIDEFLTSRYPLFFSSGFEDEDSELELYSLSEITPEEYIEYNNLTYSFEFYDHLRSLDNEEIDRVFSYLSDKKIL